MPISPGFEVRLEQRLIGIAREFGTPFHIYDEEGIRKTCQKFAALEAIGPFRQYFAAKALPNPHVLKIIAQEGMGLDCASVPELELAEMAGLTGESIFFTSNNTQDYEFAAARRMGAIINLDDSCFLETLDPFPDLACFRINVNGLARNCRFMGSAGESKFGVPEPQLEETYIKARELGATRFGVHAMLCSNELDVNRALELAGVILARAARLSDAIGEPLEFINIGGGIGIPYHVNQPEFDLERFAAGLAQLKCSHFPKSGKGPAIFMECGRYVTGPHGVLVTKVVNVMRKWRNFIGVDAGMSALMRPALYPDAYHHITLPFTDGPEIIADVVGSLCENNDKLAIQRSLKRPDKGDLMVIHDTGAHAGAMGFTYNGRLRPKELLMRCDGSVMLIRRAEESHRDYFSTITPPNPATEYFPRHESIKVAS
jgi:diaminopimelate decarboxylase